MILVFARRADRTAARVEAELRRRARDLVCVDTRWFPASASVTVRVGGRTDDSLVLHLADRDVHLSDVRAVWGRQAWEPVAQASDALERKFIERELHDQLDDVALMLECAWLPGRPRAIIDAQFKARQLLLARRVGFTTPATLVSQRPAEVLELHREHDGPIVSKLLGTGFFATYGTRLARYTERLRPRDLAHLGRIRQAPAIFQPYIEKAYEVRAVVVGSQVFAAEIQSQVSQRTRCDWRRYDHRRTPHAVHALPADVAARCVELVRALGTTYGAIDLIVTHDGDYVFLEVNPAGQYLWLEEAAGLPISAAICDFLCAADDEKVTAP